MFSSTSQASFVFSFSESSVEAQIGGPGVSVDLIARNNGAASDTLTQYSMLISQTTTSSNITPANAFLTLVPPTAGITFMSGQSIVLGSYTFTASSGAVSPEVAVYEGFSGSNFTSDNLGSINQTIGNSLTITAVPEPTSLVMFGSVIGLGLLRRRR
jgi:hypothetical protein